MYRQTLAKPSQKLRGFCFFIRFIMDNVNTHIIKVKAKLMQNMSFNEAKALAMLVWMKVYEQEHPDTPKDYTINELHNITGLHFETVKKRLLTLEKMGMLGYSERKFHYTFTRVKARNKKKNISITTNNNMTVKQVEKSILAARLQMKLRQKEYLRNVFSIARTGYDTNGNAVKLDKVKRARKYLREHCIADYKKTDFTDNGWSYKSIAKYLGVSIKTAFDIIKDAISNNFFVKHTRSVCKKIISKLDTYYIDHTFVFHGYMYKVYANTYTTNQSGSN